MLNICWNWAFHLCFHKDSPSVAKATAPGWGVAAFYEAAKQRQHGVLRWTASAQTKHSLNMLVGGFNLEKYESQFG